MHSPEQTLGLEFQLQPSWRIYWRHPGAAGLAPSLDWQGSRNIAGVELDWPVPRRLSQDGLESFIYEDHVILPLRVKLVDPRRPADLRLVVSYGACSNICIPYRDSFALRLGVNSTTPLAGIGTDQWQSLAQLPQPMTEAQAAEISDLALRPRYDKSGEGGLALSLTLSPAAARGVTDILVDAAGFAGFGLAPQFRETQGGAAVTIPLVGGDAAGWQGQSLTLTLIRPNGQSTVWQGRPPWQEAASPAAGGFLTLVAMVLLALAGGVILNLMPCVLPVLSFKILGAVKLVGREHGTIRRQFLATAAGIISSFLVLALVVVGLRQFGIALGWGGQFQQPWFLGLMVVLLVVFGLNLLGVFRLVAPEWLGRVSQLDSARPLVSAYLAGVFTTLLATPCTAPVVGTAVSFALASHGALILLIFAALGVGMASPYLVAAVYPRLLSVLPRPGRWMEWLRRGLGLGVLVTAAWLGWVLWTVLRPPVPEPALQHSQWQNFESETQITRALESDRPVLVDITADWCLSCLVNRKLVLDRPEVLAALKDSGTLLLRGDWTRPNPFLEQHMARANRYAIPFNQYYSAAHPRGLLLPELLSKDGLLEVIDKR